MKTFFIIILLVITSILIAYIGRWLIESLINLKYLKDEKTPTSGGHIKVDKKTHSCQATGEHKLLPFD